MYRYVANDPINYYDPLGLEEDLPPGLEGCPAMGTAKGKEFANDARELGEAGVAIITDRYKKPTRNPLQSLGDFFKKACDLLDKWFPKDDDKCKSK